MYVIQIVDIHEYYYYVHYFITHETGTYYNFNDA